MQRNEPTPRPFFPALSTGGTLQGVDAPRHVLASVEITQWKGMASNINKHILRDQYTALQHNLRSVVFGQAQVRGGLRKARFDEEVF